MEKNYRPFSGWLILLIAVVLSAFTVYAAVERIGDDQAPFVITGSILLLTLCVSGFMAVEPNSSRVLILFGDYKGTVKESGFFWVNPFFMKKKVSLRANNLETSPIKVNDKGGNPIMIGAVIVWKVEDTFKATFDVDHYAGFVKTQSEAAIRKIAGSFSYDHFEDKEAEIVLRSNSNEVNEVLEHEISERLKIAGILIIESRISHLAYSTEIAHAMLQRQQASAIIAARSKIVEGAVGMVEMALAELSKKQIVELDEEKKAAMVSNLMVVLCSDKSTTPIVNTGTLYQ